jgi:hypothetical protein
VIRYALVALLACNCSRTLDLGENVDWTDGGAAGTSVPGDIVQACDPIVAAACAQMASCAPLLLGTSFGDIGTCLARLKLSCVLEYGAPGSGWTADGMIACAEAIQSASCLHSYWGNPPSACEPPPGLLPNGSVCAYATQCMSGYCKVDGYKSCGVCSPRVEVGGSCTEAAGCKPGDSCVCTGSDKCNGQCSAGGGEGDLCPPLLCSAGLYCGDGRCKPQATTPGAPCSFQGEQCAGDLGLSCNYDTFQCELFHVYDVGQECSTGPWHPGGFSEHSCRGGADCKLTGVTDGGYGVYTCMAPLADGEDCVTEQYLMPGVPIPDLTYYEACLPPAQCLNGKCQIVNPSTCK